MARDLIQPESSSAQPCVGCQELARHLAKFIRVLEQGQNRMASDWLTVAEIADELKLSKSIVYRIIRNGELEAINVVDTNGQIAQRGHYRVSRDALKRYVEEKKVKVIAPPSPPASRTPYVPKVKNHLGL